MLLLSIVYTKPAFYHWAIASLGWSTINRTYLLALYKCHNCSNLHMVNNSFSQVIIRVANSPVFPGTSRISAHVSRIPAYAFLGVGHPVNVFRIVSVALSIPGSNAFCKRVSSLMNAKWRATRNRASLSLIKNDLQIYLNYEKSCEFRNYILTEPKLLCAAASGEKYYCRKKQCFLHCIFGIWHSCDTY